MSEGNVDVIQRLYGAMDVQDAEALAEIASPDMEWIPDWRVGEGPVRGIEEVIRFFRGRAEVLEELRTEPERVWDLGDRVLVFVRHTGSGTTSGAGFDIRIAHLWTLRDGVVVRGEGYADRDEALEAAGISE
jgi:ketosteroid isomerase-like protein